MVCYTELGSALSSRLAADGWWYSQKGGQQKQEPPFVKKRRKKQTCALTTWSPGCTKGQYIHILWKIYNIVIKKGGMVCSTTIKSINWRYFISLKAAFLRSILSCLEADYIFKEYLKLLNRLCKAVYEKRKRTQTRLCKYNLFNNFKYSL
jgi:hypothetical protein